MKVYKCYMAFNSRHVMQELAKTDTLTKKGENKPYLSIYCSIKIRKGDNHSIHCNWKDSPQKIIL